MQFSRSINDELSCQYYVFIIKSLSYFISSHHEYWVIDNKTVTSVLYTKDKQVLRWSIENTQITSYYNQTLLSRTRWDQINTSINPRI